MALPPKGAEERRRSSRIPILSPIRFEWDSPGGEVLRARGLTRNISAHGVYSYIEHPLSVGLELEFVVAFPQELYPGDDSVMFRCRGVVLECERFQSRFGVAISILERHRIETIGFHQRSSARLVPPSTVTACIADEQAEVKNLSATGAFITDLRTLPVGSVIGLCLHAREWPTSIEVHAVVRRIEPGVGIGVEFVTLTTVAQRQLRTLAETAQ